MLRIEISTEGAAFGEAQDWQDLEGRSEVARILRKLADQLESVGMATTLPLYDVNGNRVGEATR